MKLLFVVAPVLVLGFGERQRFQEDSQADPTEKYVNSVFQGPESYTTPSNLLQRKGSSYMQTAVDFSSPIRAALDKVHEIRHDEQPSSFLQSTNWNRFFTPFSSLQEAKAAQLRIESADEALADKQSMMRTKIEAFKAELESQLEAAKKEKKDAQDRLARRGGGSSFVQTRLGVDFANREFAKINEMQRNWKLNADRLGHAELSSVNEPSAALIDANSKVDADRKRMARLSAAVAADIQKVDNDASIVASQQAKLKKEQEMRQI